VRKEVNVFLSYSYEDRYKASEIKAELEANGLEVFLAHDDIKPSLEWQKIIFEELEKCDIFIPLFSYNFKESKWTDQEIGIAYCHQKYIIPISLDDMAPYGFVGKYQSLKLKDVKTSCDEIIEAILSKPLAERYKEIILDKFIESESYDDANTKVKRLMTFKSFTDSQLNDLVFGYITNAQVRGSWQGGKFVQDLVDENKERLNPLLLKLFEIIEEKSGDVFFIDHNLIEEMIQDIMDRRSNINTNRIKDLIK
jgi:hypothetical protein